MSRYYFTWYWLLLLLRPVGRQKKQDCRVTKGTLFNVTRLHTFLTCTITYKNNETWHVDGLVLFTSENSQENLEWLVCPTNWRETLQAPSLFVVIGHLVVRLVTVSWPCMSNNAFFPLKNLAIISYSNPGWEKFSISSFLFIIVQFVWPLLSQTLFCNVYWETCNTPLGNFTYWDIWEN